MIVGQLKIGQLQELEPVLDNFEAQRLFLVVDRVAYRASGAEQTMIKILGDRFVSHFDQFEVNPKWADVLNGVARFKESPCDVVVAIGGGTAIDVAKMVRCFVEQSGDLDQIAEGKAPVLSPTIPLIAVPTTAGTGSEATHFAVVYRDGKKHSIAHESIVPDVAVVDWRLTRTLPSGITATTGLDALCQAIESLWSVHSSEASRRFGTEAAALAIDHLADAVNAPSDEARDAMSRAANLAGAAINLTKTTAPHAISYAITHDHGIPHGHAVALTLGPILEFNSAVTTNDVIDSRGVVQVQEAIARICQLFHCETASEARLAFEQLMRSIGCATRLSKLGIGSPDQIAKIADEVNADRLDNNPRRISNEQIAAILTSIQ